MASTAVISAHPEAQFLPAPPRLLMLSDARLDALIAQVHELSKQLTKQVALNAQLQRQIVVLSTQLQTVKPTRTLSHSPTTQKQDHNK